MDRDGFWALIESARRAGDDCEGLSDRLVEALGTLPSDEIVSFQKTLDELMAESFRWDLMGAAALLNAGVTDDGFDYFRGWLIGQGRDVYERALRDPDSLALHPQVSGRDPERAWRDPLECEAMLYPADEAYEAVTGEELPSDLPWPSREPGERWNLDDRAELRRRYPRLWTAVGWDKPS